MVQGLWFTTQCLARVHQHLAVTELEVATLAFALVNVFIWLLWWNKPLDVQRQIVVGPAKPPDALPIMVVPIAFRNRFLSAIEGHWDISEYDPLLSTSVPSFWSLLRDEIGDIQGYVAPLAIEALVGAVFGAIHCAAWNADFPTAVEKWIWRSCSSLIVAIPAVILLCAALVLFTDINKSQLGKAMTIIGLCRKNPVWVVTA
jgi:hypothetical protein